MTDSGIDELKDMTGKAEMHEAERFALVHYHEIGLKGKNRPFFENRLRDNIKRSLRDLEVGRVFRIPGRILVALENGAPWEEIESRLEKVFGIAYFTLATKVPLDLDRWKEAIGQQVVHRDFSTFRVTTKRPNKNFPLNSQEINAEIGRFIQDLTGAPVDLDHADLIVHLEVLYREALFYFEKTMGPGGLPTSVSGKVGCLLSGGIDSPVASFQLMKRGCRALFIHFHSYPMTTLASQEKVIDIVTILNRYQLSSRLYLVPFLDIQKEVALKAPPPSRVILYRRMMARLGEAIAKRERAKAIVTGESLGQVASQTLQNLATIEEAVEVPVLRPLIGQDKLEIVEEAQAIGTYPISILPDEDCCQLFTPRHPATRTDVASIKEAEAALDIDKLVAQGLEKLELRRFQ